MKSKAICILFNLLFVSILSHAQEQTLPSSNLYKGIDLGFDISSPMGKLIEKGWTNYEASIVVGNFHNILGTAELGIMDFSMSKNDDVKTYNYKASGNYLRIGADYNMYKKNLPGENYLVFTGLRYGISKTTSSADNIFIQDSIWAPRYASLPEKNTTSHWIELVGGIKVPFFTYFAMGWTLRYKFLISPGSKESNKPYYIAGYGKGNDNTAFGITYSLYFTIPLITTKP